MPKESIIIESEAELCLRNNQLKIKLINKDEEYSRPIEDIHIIIIDHHSVHLTIPLINTLAQNNVAVVFCNEHHYPTTMLMDLESNHLQTKYFRFQIDASKPLKKQLWKRIVERKIINQSKLLSELGIGKDLLKNYYSNVKSGDSTNREGAAAKVYWKYLLGSNFVRERDGMPPNNLLNYGYALLRSYMCRAIMNSGLLPIIGIFHKSYYNSFPLSDDLIEPYRPYIDRKVYSLVKQGNMALNKSVKGEFFEMFYNELKYKNFTSTTSSLAQIFVGDEDNLWFPTI